MDKNHPRFDHVYMAANLCNESLTEILYVSRETSSQEELDLLNSHTIAFYRVVLQYCFNSEYNKLLVDNLKYLKLYPNTNASSLFFLNELVFEDRKDSFERKYQENLSILKKILQTDYYQKMRLLRDKKFSHSDDHTINNPLQIKGLTDDEIATGFDHLTLIFNVFENCTSQYGFSFSARVPHNENRTRNFIRFHAVYKKYYSDTRVRAISEGYKLH